MTHPDVAARLATGQLAVDHTQHYVRAAHLLGYQHPELTAHDAQVHDWYDGETGLDLPALDGDGAALRATAAAAEEALRLQRTQLGDLAAAWAGSGGDAATAFLRRHCAAGAEAAAAVHAAADSYAALIDTLWRLVDDKVATAIDIDDRCAAQRPVWLAAAQTVATGVGDRAAAHEVVERQVTPYVDNDIRVDWLTAMRATRSAVAAAYDGAAETMAAPAPYFALPGELATPYPQPAVAVPVAPAAALPPRHDPPPAPQPVTPAPDPAPPRPPEPTIDGSASGPYGDPAAGSPLGAEIPTGSGALSGLIGQIANAIGALLGTPNDGLDPLADDATGIDDELAKEPDDPDEDPENTEDTEEPEQDEPVDAATDRAPVEDDAAQTQDGAVPAADPPAEPEHTEALADSPPPAAPQPPAEEAAATPCQIAAEELPQAGQ
ncbi:hypothetical protein ACAG26_01610 [Mycobacterium sp. pUA109]|uniref:hypothetical protein n=1 Tax=Mycobacterium sp. pUA109 TaxID=3238982 RepID=UPI00351BCD90